MTIFTVACVANNCSSSFSFADVSCPRYPPKNFVILILGIHPLLQAVVVTQLTFNTLGNTFTQPRFAALQWKPSSSNKGSEMFDGLEI